MEELLALDSEVVADRLGNGGLLAYLVGQTLTRVPSAARQHWLRKVGMGLRIEIERLAEVAVAHEPWKRALDLVCDALFWDLVYCTRVELYERFAQTQDFDLAELFPCDRLVGKDVVDVGCGTGRVLKHAAASGARTLLGVDPSARMLEVARTALPNYVELRRGSFRSLPVNDGAADVLCSCMAFSVEKLEPAQEALFEMMRVVRPGGEIHVIVGANRTADFLKENGFSERVVLGGYGVTNPDLWPSDVRDLHERVNTYGHRRLFDWVPWSPQATGTAVSLMLEGRSEATLFPDSEILRPARVAVYSHARCDTT